MLLRSAERAAALLLVGCLGLWAAGGRARTQDANPSLGEIADSKSKDAGQPAVHSQGKLEILNYCAVDLDAGESTCAPTGTGGQVIEPDGKNFDLWFAANGTRTYANPRNRAEVSEPRRAEIGKSGCAAAQYSRRPLRLDGVPAGAHFCVRTVDNRYSEVILETAFTANADQITLSYTTWER